MVTVIFFAFYDKRNYELLLKHADDRKKLEDDWEDWLANFIQTKGNFINEFEVIDYPVDVEIMQQYFKKNKFKNTGAERAKYAREKGEHDYELKHIRRI